MTATEGCRKDIVGLADKMGIAVDRTIRIRLTEAQVADLQAAVDSGAYASREAIVHEAIAAWRLEHTLHPAEKDRLRHLWEAGKGSESPRSFDIERIITSARGRLGKAAAE